MWSGQSTCSPMFLCVPSWTCVSFRVPTIMSVYSCSPDMFPHVHVLLKVSKGSVTFLHVPTSRYVPSCSLTLHVPAVCHTLPALSHVPSCSSMFPCLTKRSAAFHTVPLWSPTFLHVSSCLIVLIFPKFLPVLMSSLIFPVFYHHCSSSLTFPTFLLHWPCSLTSVVYSPSHVSGASPCIQYSHATHALSCFLYPLVLLTVPHVYCAHI